MLQREEWSRIERAGSEQQRKTPPRMPSRDLNSSDDGLSACIGQRAKTLFLSSVLVRFLPSKTRKMRKISRVKKNRQMPGGISCIGSGWNVDATDERKRREREVRGDHNSRCRIWQMDLSSSAVIRYHYVVMVQKLISYRKPFDWELRTDPISEIIKDLSFLRILKIAFSMEKFLCR